jgi:hypothetical protein
MPQRVIADDVIPGADARQRRVDQDKLAHAIAMLGGKGVTDHVADIVGDKIDLADFQCVQDSVNVLALSLFVVPTGRPLGKAHAAKIRHDYGVIAHELCGQWRPHVAGLAVAVQQHHSRACAADPHVKLGAVGRDHRVLERRRERLDARSRRHCGQRQKGEER